MLRRFLGPSLVLATITACARPTPVAQHGVVPRLATGSLAAAVPPIPIAPAPVVGRLATARTGSGVLLADLDGKRVAYVADEDASLVRVIEIDSERELSRFAPGGAPGQIAMLADGRLVVAVRDAAKLLVLRGGGSPTSPLVVDAAVDVAAEPIGLAITPDDESIVATSGWGRTVTVLDAHTFTVKATHAVAREPRSVVISDDGKRAFVSHAVGQAVDVVMLDSAADAKGAKKAVPVKGDEELFGFRSAPSMHPREACQGFALAKTVSGRVLAPHVLVFAGEPTISEGYGGSSEGRAAEVFHVPVIDEGNGKAVGGSLTLRSGIESTPALCALPRAAVVGKAGLFVTCLGEDTVQLFDSEALNPQDLALKHWSVPAGPTAIALDEDNDRAIVWSQFAHALTTIAIASAHPFALSSVSFDSPNEDVKIARGRRLFHATTDTRISSDGRACASCHPDGRDDTLVWSSPKGPRQTPMLAGRLEGAAPFGWNGDAPDVSKHLVSTMKRLGGSGLEGDDKDALMAYVLAMSAPPHQAKESDAIAHGRTIFQSDEAGCASCHGAGGDLPDGTNHDVKSRNMIDVQAKFDTPSLRFVGGSAPYFHDGRYPDLKTLLVKSDGKMGHTKQLSPTDLDDLTSYLETL